MSPPPPLSRMQLFSTAQSPSVDFHTESAVVKQIKQGKVSSSSLLFFSYQAAGDMRIVDLTSAAALKDNHSVVPNVTYAI